jgi:hypothetical protein
MRSLPSPSSFTPLRHKRFPTVAEAAQVYLLNDAYIMHEQELAQRLAMRNAEREQPVRERAAKPTSVKRVNLFALDIVKIGQHRADRCAGQD